MSYCGVCRNKTLKRFYRDIFTDKIGNPPTHLSDILGKIIVDIDYQILSTAICGKCTYKLSCYYKALQDAEKYKLEIVELMQNQKDIVSGSSEIEMLEIKLEKDEKEKETDVMLSTEGEEIAEERELGETSEETIKIEAEVPPSMENENKLDEESTSEISTTKSGRPIRNKKQLKRAIKIPSAPKNKKKLKKKNPIKTVGATNEDEINSEKVTNLNEIEQKSDEIKTAKKSVDCSKSEGTYIYHSSQMGQPIGIHCESCDHIFKNPRTFHAHKKYEGSAGYICEICGIQCLTKAGIKDHTKLHETEKEFKCTQCNAEFHKKVLFKRHMAVHKGETPYQCEVCAKRFIYQAALGRHRLIHDESTRRIDCKVCDKKFRTVAHLRRHMAIHTGAKPYSCPICGNRFSQAYNMKAHMKLHDGTPTKKKKIINCEPINCQKCSNNFTNLFEYQEHIKKCL